MQIKISGQSVEIGSSFADYIKDHLNDNVKKYFDHALDASVVFSKVGEMFSVIIIVNEGVKSGLFIKASYQAFDPYVCFDGAMDKISTRLRRYKRRIKSYRKDRDLSDKIWEALDVSKYVLPISHEQVSEEDTSPKIIGEKQTKIERLSVNDAIMKMELSSLPALLFIDESTGRLNLVYHRADGNISWIDTQIKA